jgi:hypothetical protein
MEKRVKLKEWTDDRGMKNTISISEEGLKKALSKAGNPSTLVEKEAALTSSMGYTPEEVQLMKDAGILEVI